MLIVEKCPLCGDSKKTKFDERYFRERRVVNQLCTRCGFVYQSPRMSGEELTSFYAEEYRMLYQDSPGPNPKDLAIQKGRAQSLVKSVRKWIAASPLPQPGRHLDIGCSAGLLLQEVKNTYQTTAVGIEPGTAYRSYAQSTGLTVHASLDELKGQERPFDLISLVHVLEHIPNPVEYLSDLREWLQPNGWLLVEVPNLYGHDCFEVAHLISFSQHTLQGVLQQAGYEVVQVRVHGEPRSKILPLYITVLGKPTQTVMKLQVEPEKGVRLKRHIAMLVRRFKTHLYPKQAWLLVKTP